MITCHVNIFNIRIVVFAGFNYKILQNTTTVLEVIIIIVNLVLCKLRLVQLHRVLLQYGVHHV